MPEPSSSKDATQPANARDAALQTAIAQAEAALKAMRLSKDPGEKQRLKAQFEQRLRDAEDIKRSDRDTPTVDAAPGASPRNKSVILQEPLSSRTLLKGEQILLLKASFLNGNKFSPWTERPSAMDFQLQDGETLHIDDMKFSLSPYQQKVFAGWERPNVAFAGTGFQVEPMMDHVNPIDLVQDASTDCSVVASLCAGVARVERGHTRLLRPVLFPQNDELGVPMLSHNGKYIVRLNFNGCYRRVVIDDRLPKSKTERIIHVIDRQNPTLLWPALVEKAYLKIRGGYDFPGSNSATDLWIITGWIPEQVFLQTDDLDLESFWSRVSNAFTYGDVLITMGTGKMSRQLEKEIGLAGEHDYAILDMKEVRGQRLMLVKNPWCEGTNWYRVPRRLSKVDQDLLAASGTNQDTEDDLTMQSPRDLLNADAQLMPGTFWMDIDNAAQYFESIYLNWNPGLFTYRQDLHFAWDLSISARGAHASFQHNPQFSISTHRGGTIWILLCRHLRDAPTTEGQATHIDLAGFIAVSAYAVGGKTIKLASRAISRSNFVDSPQILLKVQDCQPGEAYTIIPFEQELMSSLQTFTISAFGNSALTLDWATPAYPHIVKSSSSWTKDSAGGNANSPTYSTNPQFAVKVSRSSRLLVLLETANETLNVHIKLVHGQGERIRAVRNRDILFDSADYRRRCCVADSKCLVEAGIYTMICSTFEPQQYGRFDVLVESDEAVSITPLPREGAGRLQLSLNATFPATRTKIAAKLDSKRLAKMYVVVRRLTGDKSGSMPIRASIEQGHGAQRRLLSSSDRQMATDIEPARLDDFDLAPGILRYGDLWVVLERICIADQAAEQSVELYYYIDQPDAISFGPWLVLEE